MKKYITRIIVLFSISFCQPVFAQNLILNGGFETATIGIPLGNPLPFYPTFLNNWAAVNVDGEYIKEPIYAHTGTGFLSLLQNQYANNQKLSWLGSSGAGGYDRAVQLVNVSPSTAYHLTFWIRSGNSNRYFSYTDGYMLLQVEQFLPTKATIDSMSVFADSTWRQVSMNFTTGVSCSQVAVLLSCYGDNNVDVWYDDIDLRSSIPVKAGLQASDSLFCEGECISFSNLSQNATSYQWLFPGGIPASDTSANPSLVCYAKAGSYDVTLIAYAGAVSDTLTFHNYIVVNTTPPTPVITQSGMTLYCETDTSYITYQWYDSTALIQGATDTSLVISHDGNYNVQVTNKFGCSIAVGITIITGFSNYIEANELSLFPNPVNDKLLLSCSAITPHGVVMIYNALGENIPVLSLTEDSTNKPAEMDVSALPAGVYVLVIESGKGRYSHRFVKY